MASLPAARRYRRCAPVHLSCGDRLALDTARLLQGELALQCEPLLRARVPPQPGVLELEPLAAACLAALAQGQAHALPPALQALDGVEAVLQRLLDLGLIEAAPDEPAPLAAPPPADALEDWDELAALYHYASRWSGVQARDEIPLDADGATRAFDASRAAFEQQAQARGAPPEHRPSRGDVARAVALPDGPRDGFDALLAARETHRLFAPERLSLETVAQLLRRSFGAHASAPLGGGLVALRKAAPSGGGMHPVEAYPLVVDVDGLASGWYHYRACDHALAPLRALAPEAARAAIGALAAGQSYFASAPLVVALTLRFPRHHWKYPRHARAYRVMLLEAGHVGQTFYLAATQAGLGAFFTAAVNDADVDAALGLDGVQEGCIALLGCGRAAPDGAALRLSAYVAPD